MVVSYQGTRYHGWQRQKHVDHTLQQTLEAALSRIANEPVEVVCAGRTDAGVHASAQVVHFDTSARRNAQAWVSGTNHFLPDTLAVRWVGAVNSDFHARYGARSRTYRYFILNSRIRSALAANNLTWFSPPLDETAMEQGGRFLLGEHDFSSFRDSECQSCTPFRNLMDLRVRRAGEVVMIQVQANAFLHHMVRNITGTLLDVGSGRRPPHWMAEVLDARQRSAAGVTAPPDGLYFVAVDYPEMHGLPQFPPGPDFMGAAFPV